METGRTYTFNAENWGDGEVTYRLNKDMTFKVADDKFKMKERNCEVMGRVYDVFNEDKELEFSVFEIEAGVWCCTAFEVVREARNPFIAAVRLLLMIM